MDAGGVSPLASQERAVSPQPKKRRRVIEHDVPLLCAKGITKVFSEGKEPSRKVLNGLNLEIRRQSLVVIRGESGSGKSTLLRILGLVDWDFEGRLEVDGEQVGGLSAAALEDLRARHIGFVFQDDLLLPLLNLRENSELPAHIHRLPEVKTRLDRLQALIFRSSELEEGVMRRHRTSVSGGQRQRAAILRAVSHGPDLILADEPTASLDLAAKKEVVKLFERLCQRGHTIVIASHDSVFDGKGETYELSEGKLDGPKRAPKRYPPKHVNVNRPTRPRRCPTGLRMKIARREALGNPLFALMIVAAMAAGLFQLTLLWSIRAGTESVLDEVINKGSRLDRVVVAAKAQAGESIASGLPSGEVLADLGNYRRTVRRREILLRVDDSRGRERQETTFGLIPDDPEVEKLELREGEPFEDQHALSVLITERSVERLFGDSAVDQAVVGRRIPLRFRRYVTEEEMEEISLDYTVRGVVDRAEAGRNLYLPQGTLLAIATWQVDSEAELKRRNGRIELVHKPGKEEPAWERLHVYFNRLDQVLPAVAYFERRGFSATTDLTRYKWILDTRRFVSWMLGGIVSMVMFIAGLLIISNVVSGVRLKRKEIAVLKLMGMKDGDVVSIFVFSTLMCALLGGAVGFGAGSLTVDGLRTYLSATYPESPLGQVLTSTWAQAGYALLLCAIVTVGFTVLPAWQTARKEAVWKLD